MAFWKQRSKRYFFFRFRNCQERQGTERKEKRKNAQDKAFGEYFVSSSPFFPFFNQRRCRLEGCRPSKQGFRGSPNRARVLFLFRYSDAGELDANKRKSWRWRAYAKLALWRKIDNVAASYWLHYTETNVRALSWLKSVLRLVCESVSVACLSLFHYSRQHTLLSSWYTTGHGVEQAPGLAMTKLAAGRRDSRFGHLEISVCRRRHEWCLCREKHRR